MTEPITWETLSAAIGVMVALATAAGGLWWRLHMRIASIEQVSGERIALVRAELGHYKLQVAEKYASMAHLKEVEGRLVASIDRLSDRIDRLLTRLDPDLR